MTPDIRWLALLPDPVTGLDQPVLQAGNRTPMIWIAPDRVKATRLVKAALRPAAFRLCSVISVLDWDARQRDRQRPKLSAEPNAMFGGVNPRQACWRCGAPTPTRNSRYCPAHRQHGGRKRNTAA